MVDYSAINAAARTGTSGLSINDRQEASRASLADSEQTFLKLMTTQLKNQDPLSPVDSNAFTQQIVQMTGVEQQLLTNDLLKVLVGMNDGGISGQVGLIGKEVTTTSTTGTLADKSLTFDYNLPRAAGALKLEVVDAAGKTMEEIVQSVKRVTDIMSEITAASLPRFFLWFRSFARRIPAEYALRFPHRAA